MTSTSERTAALERIEKALGERYNAASLEGLGPFSEALRAAADGDLEPLREAIASREMYRWTASIEEAVAELAEAEDESDEDLSKLTVPVLRERLEALQVEIPADVRKDDLVALLTEATAKSGE